jgi:hypothetical protein
MIRHAIIINQKNVAHPQPQTDKNTEQHSRTLDAQAMHIHRRSIHGVVMATRIFACSASARVCAAVMSHSDSVSGTGELNTTTKGWNSGV